jgi:UDP-4-amino-4-deoxy-L-arabinose-oxoglutarate aminotransferase
LNSPLRVPFHVPSIDESDIPGVVATLREKWVTTGQRCRDFEAAFASHLNRVDPDEGLQAIAVNSCTAALHLALEAVGVGEGDRVIVPAWTFTASAEVIRYLGADPLFVDVDEDSFLMTPELVRRALGGLSELERESIRAIMPVHFGGLAADMEGFEALCEEQGWALVDDAAHALPTNCEGLSVGRWGHVSAFSFYATKTLCTGEGGMVVTSNAELADRMRVMRLHGISRDAFDRYRSDEPAWEYEIVAPGFKYNMSDLMAALGLSQLERVDQFRDARAKIAAAYDRAFESIEELTLAPRASRDQDHAWHLYALRVEGGRTVRDRLIEELATAGIGTSVHFIPLHLHPYWRDRYELTPADFPIASALFEQEVSLPIFPSMSEEQIQRVTSELPQALERARARVSPS